MHTAFYIAACTVIPAVWGIAVAAAYERLATRRDRLAIQPQNEPDKHQDTEH